MYSKMAKIQFPTNTEIRYIPEEKQPLILVSAVNRLTSLNDHTPTEATNNVIITENTKYSAEATSSKNDKDPSLEQELQKIIVIFKEAILSTKEENSTIFSNPESKESQCLEQINLITQKITKHFKSLSLEQIAILEKKLKDRINYLMLTYNKKLKNTGLTKILATTNELLTLKNGASKSKVSFVAKFIKDKKTPTEKTTEESKKVETRSR